MRVISAMIIYSFIETHKLYRRDGIEREKERDNSPVAEQKRKRAEVEARESVIENMRREVSLLKTTPKAEGADRTKEER